MIHNQPRVSEGGFRLHQSGKMSKMVNSAVALFQNASHLLVVFHADEGIEYLFAQVIAACSRDRSDPAFQLGELADGGRAGHVHIGGNLGEAR